MTEAEELARTLVHSGFHDEDEVVTAITDTFEDELSESDAEALVERVWGARVAEQATWPAETEADRLLAAFVTLEAHGIVARADFTCCNNCGNAEIAAEAEDNARGFVFFHQQDTERAVLGDGLYLSHGTFGTTDPTAVGEEIVAALAARDLPAEWDGNPGQRILVSPLTWQLRLS